MKKLFTIALFGTFLSTSAWAATPAERQMNSFDNLMQLNSAKASVPMGENGGSYQEHGNMDDQKKTHCTPGHKKQNCHKHKHHHPKKDAAGKSDTNTQNQ